MPRPQREEPDAGYHQNAGQAAARSQGGGDLVAIAGGGDQVTASPERRRHAAEGVGLGGGAALIRGRPASRRREPRSTKAVVDAHQRLALVPQHTREEREAPDSMRMSFSDQEDAEEPGRTLP